MTVKRYGISGFGGGMVAQEDGAFYHMDDYDALQSINAELLEALSNVLGQPFAPRASDAVLLAAAAVAQKARSQS